MSVYQNGKDADGYPDHTDSTSRFVSDWIELRLKTNGIRTPEADADKSMIAFGFAPAGLVLASCDAKTAKK